MFVSLILTMSGLPTPQNLPCQVFKYAP